MDILKGQASRGRGQGGLLQGDGRRVAGRHRQEQKKTQTQVSHTVIFHLFTPIKLLQKLPRQRFGKLDMVQTRDQNPFNDLAGTYPTRVLLPTLPATPHAQP